MPHLFAARIRAARHPCRRASGARRVVVVEHSANAFVVRREANFFVPRAADAAIQSSVSKSVGLKTSGLRHG